MQNEDSPGGAEKEVKIISAINNTMGPSEMPSFLDKVKNAFVMIKKEGFGPFLHKINRMIYHSRKNLVRKIFYPNSGQKLREEAKKNFLHGKKLPTLSIVVTALGINDMTKLCLSKLVSNKMGDVEIVLMAGGDTIVELKDLDLPSGATNVKIVKDTEVYPAFKFWMENTTGDIMLFIHNDVMIDEYGFDVLLRYVFQKDQNLGMVGFVGSDELNEKGGRGWGTTSNFLGKTYSYNNKTWEGTPASLHGMQYDGLTPAVMVDGCSMAIRRNVWNKLGYHPAESIYYFYDRLMCCRILEVGYRIGTLGVACDHIANQTASKEIKYHEKVHRLFEKLYGNENVPTVKDSTGNINWDMSLHAEVKRRFLKEWRDDKHIIPIQI